MTTTTTPAPFIHPFERAHLGKAPFRFIRYRVAKYQACPGAPIQPGSSCDYCGTGIMGVYEIRSADGIDFKVGCDCVRRCYEQAPSAETAALLAEVKAARKEAQLQIREDKRNAARGERIARAAEDRAKRAREFIAATPGLATALESSHDIVVDLAAKLAKYGSLSRAQVALALRIAAEAERKANEPERLVTAPLGKRTFEGEVVSVKAQEGAYGVTMRMTVKVRDVATGETWLAWGTMPRALGEAVWANDERAAWEAAGCDCSAYTGDRLRGRRVAITATLKPGREPHFALMERPRGKLLPRPA